jgi:uncharacterized protein YcbK (DUF882 family)
MGWRAMKAECMRVLSAYRHPAEAAEAQGQQVDRTAVDDRCTAMDR